jgi:hypothetical protein
VQAREQRGDVGIRRRREAMEDWPRGRRRPRVDALEHQRVKVDVQVECAPEALDGGDRATAPAADAPLGRPLPQPAEHGAEEDPKRGTREGGVEGELVADRHRHGEHPLPDGHMRQHVIDEAGGELAHPPAATRGAEAAPLTTEGDDGSVATALTLNAQQAVTEDATAKVRLELSLHERRQPRALGIAGRLGEEGLKVGLDGPVEHGAFGLATLVGGRGRA